MLPRIGGIWRSPQNLGGSIHRDSEISATSRVAGEITVAVRWNDSSLRTRTWTDASGWANGWNLVATGISGGPSIAGRGANGLIVTWRDSAGRIRVTTGQPGGPWATSIQLPHSTRANTGPSVTTTSANPKIAFTDSATSQQRTTELAPGGSPTNLASWGAATSLSSVRAPATTTPSTGVVRMWAADNGTVYRFSPATSSGVAASYPALGTGVAGAASARPGESVIPNTPISLWSDRLASGGRQADAFWRTQDGCIATRTKTSESTQISWTTPSPSVIPARTGTRCVWPARVGTAPLFKRLDGTEYPELAAADQAWRGASTDLTSMNSYTGRDQALMYHQGPDWPTAWAIRNWHPNAWVYRKAIAYLTGDRLHEAAATAGYFVRRKSNGRPVALSWGCTSSGCPQPLLNVTLASARNFWLNGSSTAVASSGSCQNQTVNDGIIDLLACTSGALSSGGTHANARGVWVDEVLPQLTAGSNGSGPSFVADLATGVPLTNAEVLNDLTFTATQWQDGLATLMEQLRSGINTLKSQRVLRTDQGKVAINYKWTTYGFGSIPSATITSVPAATRIIQAADLVELEGGWVDPGIGGGGTTVPFSFQRRQQFVDQVHALGRNVLEEKVGCGVFAEFANSECVRGLQPTQTAASAAAHYNTAQYNLAATLLNYAPGDMVGDIADYYGRGWDGYSTDLGVPLGGRTALSTSTAGPQQRLFERGRVIVVPPGWTGGVTFSVPVGSRWRPNGNNTLTTVTSGSITLGQRRGAVLLNP